MFSLPDLPFAYDALEPVISAQTLRFHHDKHHAAYVTTTNTLLEEAGGSPGSLEDVIRQASSSGSKKLFNNAAQAWNHAFFWESLSPERAKPEGELAAAIDKAFGSLAELKSAMVTAGAGHFGSGWVWLVANGQGALQVISTHDADNTLTQASVTPLVVCDLWEHAYYLDHQNNRKGFLEVWFDALPNWRLAASQYAAAKGNGEAWRYPAGAPARAA